MESRPTGQYLGAIDRDYIKGAKKLAYFLGFIGSVQLGMAVYYYRLEGTLARRGVRVDGWVASAYEETHQHSDNIPTHYYHLVARYPIGPDSMRLEVPVSYEFFKSHKRGSSISVIYDPQSPGMALLASEARDSANSRNALLIGLGMCVVVAAFAKHIREESQIPDKAPKGN